MNNIICKIKKHINRLLIFILVFTSICFTSIHTNAQTQDIIFKGDGYEIFYTITSSWEDTFNANIKIKNTGNAVIDNWAIEFDFPYEINNIWNGVVKSSYDGICVIKNAIYNQDIGVDEYVELGFSAKCPNKIECPNEFKLLCFEDVLSEEQYQVELNVLEDWGYGYTGEILVKNISNETIEDWKLEFDFENDLNFWTSDILYHEGNHYLIKNLGYNSNIKSGETIELGFEASHGYTGENISNINVIQITNEKKQLLDLKTSKTEINSESNNKDIYFYIDLTEKDIYDDIFLYENDKSVAMFYDDGDFLNHGDDIKGDGIYSAKCIISTQSKGDFENEYFAGINKTKLTNTIIIPIYCEFTEKELADMDYVDKTISDKLREYYLQDERISVSKDYLQNGNTLKDYNNIASERFQALINTLDELINQEYIYKYSYDEINGVVNCTYSNGISFGVMLYEPLQSNDISEDYYDSKSVKYSGYSALILNAFEDSSYRTKFYENLEKNWTNKGMDVDYDDTVTIQDLKTKLCNKDIITLSGHGTVVNKQSVFCLNDDVATQSQNKEYSADIKSRRIFKLTYVDGTASYVVTGNFFKYYYGDDGLDGSFIFSESCSFMGNEQENGVDLRFANDLIDCSAESVVGFYNSVMAEYSRNLMLHYYEELLCGSTAVESLNSAKNKYGLNDFKYRKPSFFEYLIDRDAFKKLEPTAAPILVGNYKSSLAKKLQNGDFEMSSQGKYNKPLKWFCSGDVRVLKKLGTIKSYDSQMVFLSTGIGSQCGVGFSGTQGSTLSQYVYNDNKTTVEFLYDVISEEPMEYVGSRFDDKFEIQILNEYDKVLCSNILESINTSDWYRIMDINFAGGDNTVYHTKWKKASIDISSYQNQNIKIRFLVYDIGDSEYDTAVVIDNINWY